MICLFAASGRLEQGLAQYRMWVEAEEKASVDPVKHQEFLTVGEVSSNIWRSNVRGWGFGQLPSAVDWMILPSNPWQKCMICC